MSKGILESIYTSQKGQSFFESSSFYDSYMFNIGILFLMVFVCLYFYAHIDISLSLRNWHVQKCNPKYVTISGYIRPEDNMSAFDTTMYNFRECMSRGYVDAIRDFKNEMNVDIKVKEGKFIFENGINKKLHQDYENIQNDTEIIINEIGDDINDVSEDNMIQRTVAYGKLGVLGVYMDQLDQLLDYVFKYSKNYLTYLYLHRLNKYENASETSKDDEFDKTEKVKQILDEHFDGPAFY